MIHIHIRPAEKKPGQPQLYEACETDGDPYLGRSPDEALGYLVRELWLGEAFTEPVRLDLFLSVEIATAKKITDDGIQAARRTNGPRLINTPSE